MLTDVDNTICTPRATNAAAACVDAATRNAQAVQQHAAFFGSVDHQHKLQAVKNVVDSFFAVRKGVYVNHRANGGRPFTVIKVDNPQFPRMKASEVDRLYREPLRALGVEIVFSRNTNSYLYRVS